MHVLMYVLLQHIKCQFIPFSSSFFSAGVWCGTFTTEKYIMQHLISTLATPGFEATKRDNSCMHAHYCLHYSTSNANAVSLHAVYVT